MTPWVPIHTLRAKFASTHFKHGTSLTLIGKAWDEANLYWTQSQVYTDKIYNIGMVYEHPQFFPGMSGGTPAAVALELMNHNSAGRTELGTGWLKADLLDDLYGATAGHVGSHGTLGGIKDSAGVFVENTYIRQMCWNAANTGKPAVNLFFFDVCWIGSGVLLSSVLCTPDMNTTNRCAIGFTVEVDAKGSPDMGSAFWTALQAGRTAGEALRYALRAYNEVAVAKGFKQLSNGDWMLKGDPFTQLWLLYSASKLNSTNEWFKQVE